MFTFSTLMGSQLHFMALEFVAQQYEQLNFYEATLLVCVFSFFFLKWD